MKDGEIKKKTANTTSYSWSKFFFVFNDFGQISRKKSIVSAQDRTGDLLRSISHMLGRRDNRYTTETMVKIIK